MAKMSREGREEDMDQGRRQIRPLRRREG